jgi:hypothetical protein
MHTPSRRNDFVETKQHEIDEPREAESDHKNKQTLRCLLYLLQYRLSIKEEPTNKLTVG